MRAIKYLIIGICALALTFCSVVLIWAGVSGNTFTGVIQSWFTPAVEESVTPKAVKSVSAPDTASSYSANAISLDPVRGELETNIEGFTIPYIVKQGMGVLCTVELDFNDETGGHYSDWIVFTDFPVSCNLSKSFTEQSEYFNPINYQNKLVLITCDIFDFNNVASYMSVFFPTPLPADPVKEGYYFTGWYTDEACTQKFAGDTVAADMTIYAGWAIKKLTIDISAAGGTPIANMVIDWNTSVILPVTTREGYNFLGWFLSDGTEYSGQALKADTKIGARWAIKMFTVKFIVDGKEYASVTVPWGSTFGAAIDQVAAYNSLVGAKIDGKALTDYNTSSAIIGEGLTLEMETGAQTSQFVLFMTKNWWSLLISFVSLVLLIYACVFLTRKAQ